MSNKIYIYNVEAKRKDEEKWTAWTTCRDYNEALKHSRHVARLGYDSRVVEELVDEDIYNAQLKAEEEDEDDVETF